VQLGVSEPTKSNRKNRWNDFQVWGEEDWLAWEDENFWNAMDFEDFDYTDCDTSGNRQHRNDKLRKQPQAHLQKVWIPRGGHSLVVGERVHARFRARQGQMSRRLESAIVVSTPSSASVQLNFFKAQIVQSVPTSWVIVPKSMPKAISKALRPERLRIAARRRSQMQRMLAEDM
jgi:hypothetical protein